MRFKILLEAGGTGSWGWLRVLEEKRQTSALTWGVLETLGRAAVKLCLVLGLASAVSKMPGPPSPVPLEAGVPLGAAPRRPGFGGLSGHRAAALQGCYSVWGRCFPDWKGLLS